MINDHEKPLTDAEYIWEQKAKDIARRDAMIIGMDGAGVSREAIATKLAELGYTIGLKAQLEEVAKWPHEWQADFVKAMVKLMEDSPKVKDFNEGFAKRSPIMELCDRVGGKQVRRLAAYLIRELNSELSEGQLAHGHEQG